MCSKITECIKVKDVSSKQELQEAGSVSVHKAGVGAGGTEGDRSNLSECVCVLGGDDLNSKQPLNASGALCTNLVHLCCSVLVLSVSLTDCHWNRSKLGQVTKLSFCLAVKSKTGICELSLFRHFGS